MKKVTIYDREITVRTGYRKYPFKKELQFVILDGFGHEVASSENASKKKMENPNLRIGFSQTTISKKTTLGNYILGLGQKYGEMQIKARLREFYGPEMYDSAVETAKKKAKAAEIAYRKKLIKEYGELPKWYR